MYENLSALEQKYNELNTQLSAPSTISDQNKWRDLCKELADIKPIVEKYREYINLEKRITEAQELLNDNIDKDFKTLVQSELEECKVLISNCEDELSNLLLPKDPNDEKNVIIEIRGGAGGDEAALFATDLMRMYQMYAERLGWRTETLNLNNTELGGIKEVSFEVKGAGAYSKLKYESGVHRVQRVPSTESSGRIHTSTVTVAVLPEVEEVEVDINPNDLRIDVFRAGGPGGQCVNTTDSAVRITHTPTGLVVSCQDEKSQHKNKDKALKILRSRLYELMQQQQHDEISAERKNQVGTGDRSERIRTYNFPQGRCTDHRIGLTLYSLEKIMNGELDEVVTALINHYQAELKKSATA